MAKANAKVIRLFGRKVADDRKTRKFARPKSLAPGATAIACRVHGDCCSPRVRDGQIAFVENKLPEPGELAVFWFKGVQGPIIKVLSHKIYGWPHHPKSNVVMPVQFEQLNPPRRYQAWATNIELIARVHSIIDAPRGPSAPVLKRHVPQVSA